MTRLLNSGNSSARCRGTINIAAVNKRAGWDDTIIVIVGLPDADSIHLDEWWGQKVCVDFFFFRSDEMAFYLNSAGFEIEEIIERDPYLNVEHQSRRACIFARKPKVEP